MWEWERGKIRGSVSLNDIIVNQMFSHPEGETVWVLGAGRNPLRVFVVNYERTETPLVHKSDAIKEHKTYSNNIVAYCCLQTDNGLNIVLATDKSELLYVNSHNELKSKLQTAPLDEFEITAIQPWHKGFIVSGNEANFLLYEKSDRENRAKEPYVRIENKSIQNKLFPRSAVTSFIVINDEMIVLGLDNGQLQQVQLGDRNNLEETFRFDSLIQPFLSSD